MDQHDRIKLAQKRQELLQACEDLRLPVSSGDSIETLELYVKAAYDEFENEKKSNINSEDIYEDDINVFIGHSKFKSFLGKIIPFL